MPNLKFACRVLAAFFCLAPLGFAALDPAEEGEIDDDEVVAPAPQKSELV